ncbi:hypothetical protein HA520_08585 [Azotobacter chroococcum]|uniref:Uncharacterized protein n=1 Tax=Azotobacter chroococcum TaxID=353 RepID=A0AA44C662_9GAMM|nr:hypothetical protein [Azotobacter chroococcum]NHN77346.1 hypothetical protein [Azotobacter chroococcum]
MSTSNEWFIQAVLAEVLDDADRGANVNVCNTIADKSLTACRSAKEVERLMEQNPTLRKELFGSLGIQRGRCAHMRDAAKMCATHRGGIQTETNVGLGFRVDTMPLGGQKGDTTWWRESKYLSLCDESGSPRSQAQLRRSAQVHVRQVLRQIDAAKKAGKSEAVKKLRKVYIVYSLGACRRAHFDIAKDILTRAVLSTAKEEQQRSRPETRIKFIPSVTKY